MASRWLHRLVCSRCRRLRAIERLRQRQAEALTVLLARIEGGDRG